jgi:hypothetical protein
MFALTYLTVVLLLRDCPRVPVRCFACLVDNPTDTTNLGAANGPPPAVANRKVSGGIATGVPPIRNRFSRLVHTAAVSPEYTCGGSPICSARVSRSSRLPSLLEIAEVD